MPLEFLQGFFKSAPFEAFPGTEEGEEGDVVD
jgi:hypothetical protein